MADILKLTPLTYVVVLGAAISNFAMGILEPTISIYLKEIGQPSDKIGVILSGRFMLVAVFSVPLALLASRIGILKFLFVTGLTSALAGLILFLDPSASGVFSFYLVVGIAQTINSGPGMAIIAENRGTKRVSAYALFSTTWMIPPAMGSAVSYFWFKQFQNETVSVYRSIFLPVFVVLVVGGVVYSLFLSLVILKGNRPSSNTNKQIPYREQFRRFFDGRVIAAVVLFTFVQFLMGGGAGASLPFLSIYLKSMNATADQISLLSLSLNLLMGVATQLSAPLSKRFGDIKVFVVCTALSIISLLGIVFSHTLAATATFYILRGTFANMTAPISQSRVIAYVEETVRPLGSAWFSTWRWIGWTTMSPISGKIIDSWGFEISFIYTAMVYSIATAFFVFTVTTKPDFEELTTEKVALYPVHEEIP